MVSSCVSKDRHFFTMQRTLQIAVWAVVSQFWKLKPNTIHDGRKMNSHQNNTIGNLQYNLAIIITTTGESITYRSSNEKARLAWSFVWANCSSSRHISRWIRHNQWFMILHNEFNGLKLSAKAFPLHGIKLQTSILLVPVLLPQTDTSISHGIQWFIIRFKLHKMYPVQRQIFIPSLHTMSKSITPHDLHIGHPSLHLQVDSPGPVGVTVSVCTASCS